MCFYTEPCEAFASKLRTARKEHKCSECGGVIPAKTKYWFSSGISDGEAFSHKECAECTALRQRIGEKEIAAGCAIYESQPGLFELIDAAKEHGYLP